MNKNRSGLWALVALIPLLFIGIFFIWPIFSLIITGFIGNSGFSFTTLAETLTSPRTWRVTSQTLLQAVSATLASLFLGIPAAFVLYRLKFPGRKPLRVILTVPFVLPTVVVSAAFIALYGPGGALHFLGLDQSFTALVLALTFFNVTVFMRVVGSVWETLDPRQAEAARMLGASAGRVFFTVTLPNLRRPIFSAASLVFLFCATSFGVVFVLGGRKYSNIETEIYRVTMQLLDLNTSSILAIFQIIIVVLALGVSSRLKNSSSVSVVQSERSVRFAVKDHFAVLGIFVATIILLHLLPLTAMVIRSFKNSAGYWSVNNYAMLFSASSESPLLSGISGALKLSIFFALIATVLAVTIGLLSALLISRTTSDVTLMRVQKLVEYSLMLPLGVSAVVLGLGLLLTMNKPLGIGIDLRSSLILLPIAQSLIAIPLVIRTLTPALQSIHSRLKETSIMLGYSPMRTIFTLELPLIKNSIAVATGFALATSLGEFGAAAFLVRTTDKTLPVVIAQLLTHPDPQSHGAGIAASVVLAAMTATIMVAAESFSLKNRIGWAL